MRTPRAESLYLDDGLRLGGVLRTRRKELGKSREDISRRSFVSMETISKIESGATVEPGVFTLKALAEAVGLTLDMLLEEVAAQPRPTTPLRLSAKHGLLSIGYEGRASDGLIQELFARGVSVLADVRLNPISRKSGLSKRALTEALSQAQIEYLHLPALGNPKSNRDGFQDAQSQGPRDRYRRLLVSSEAVAALDVMADLSETSLVAVLCFEREESLCHREVILDMLRQRRPTTPIQRV